MKKNLIPTAAIHDKVSALTPAQKALLLLGTLLFLAAGFYFLQYKGQSDRIRKLRTSIAEQEKRLAVLKQTATQVAALEKELAQSEEEFSRLLTLLPDQKEIPGLLDSISQLGAKVGLENLLVQPQPEQAYEFYSAIPVRLDLLGTYHELGTFFDGVSKLDRILKVDNLSMTRQKGGSMLQVGCTIVTYRFVEKGAQADNAPKKAGQGDGTPKKK